MGRDTLTRMRYELIRDLMRRLDEKWGLKVGNCEAALAEKIEKLPLPLHLKRIFQWSWANKWAQVGNHRISSVKEAFTNEWFDLLINANMVEIGSAISGDMLVVLFSQEKCEVGFLNHIELAVAIDEGKNPRDFYVRVCGSLDELLYRFVEDRYLPLDYDTALESAQLQSEMDKDDRVS
jgi:hypothetical protein